MLLGLISTLAQSDSQVALRVLDYGSPDLVAGEPAFKGEVLQLYSDSRVRERLVSLLRVRHEETGQIDPKEKENSLAFVKNKKSLDIRFANRNLWGKFSKAGGLNQIIATVPPGDIVVVLDVDMRVPVPSFFSFVREKVRLRKVSLLFSFERLSSDGSVSRIDNTAATPVAFYKSDCIAAGGFALPSFASKITWGDEDQAFINRLKLVTKMRRVYSDELPGIVHLWHPRHKENSWYGKSVLYGVVEAKQDRIQRLLEEKQMQKTIYAELKTI